MKKMNEKTKNYYSRIAIMGLFVFLFHGSKLNNGIVGIDTEKLIYMKNEFYPGWLQNGRQGLVFLKMLTGSMWYNPFVSGLFTCLFLALSLFCYLLLWETVMEEEKKSIVPVIAAGLLWASHPVLTEQLYFSLQSVEVSIGLMATAVSVGLVYMWQKDKKGYRLLLAVLLAILTFCSYQAFVPLYIWTVVSVLILDTLKQIKKGQVIIGKEIILKPATYAGVFFVAFVINWVITKLFFSSSDYLDKQVMWGVEPLSQILQNLYDHVKVLQLGTNSIYFTCGYSLWLFAVVVLLCIIAKKAGATKALLPQVVVLFGYLATLMITPYLMTFVCGIAPAVRSQLIMPGMMAFLAVLLFSNLQFDVKGTALKKVAFCAGGLLLVVTGYTQFNVTERLYYTESCRAKQDEYVARRMIEEIDRLQGQYPLPVAFVGELPFEGNASTLVGETMGHSFFEHDARMEPYSYYSSGRILGYMETLGRSYHLVHAEDFEKAWEYSYYMPHWPYENSIARQEDMIVVKLQYWEE